VEAALHEQKHVTQLGEIEILQNHEKTWITRKAANDQMMRDQESEFQEEIHNERRKIKQEKLAKDEALYLHNLQGADEAQIKIDEDIAKKLDSEEESFEQSFQ
jgi:hypothetical protein